MVPCRAPLGPRLARRQELRRLLVAGTGGWQEWPTGEQGEPTAGRQEVQGGLLADEGRECGAGGQQGVTNAGLPEKVLTRQPSRLAEGQLGLPTDVQGGLFVKEPWERAGQRGRPVGEQPQVLSGTQHGLSVAEELEAGEMSSLNPFPRTRPGTSLGGQFGTEEQAFLFRSVQCLQPATTVQGGVYHRGPGRGRGRSGTTQRGRIASQQEQQSRGQCEQHSGVQHEQRQQDSRQGRQPSALRKQCVERQQGRRVEQGEHHPGGEDPRASGRRRGSWGGAAPPEGALHPVGQQGVRAALQSGQQPGEQPGGVGVPQGARQSGGQPGVIAAPQGVQQAAGQSGVIATPQGVQRPGGGPGVIAASQGVQQTGGRPGVLAAPQCVQQAGGQPGVIAIPQDVQQAGGQPGVPGSPQRVHHPRGQVGMISAPQASQRLGVQLGVTAAPQDVHQSGGQLGAGTASHGGQQTLGWQGEGQVADEGAVRGDNRDVQHPGGQPGGMVAPQGAQQRGGLPGVIVGDYDMQQLGGQPGVAAADQVVQWQGGGVSRVPNPHGSW
ncbi:unnamed protein product [Closterium sp. Naga37s-1]|nr:unnamed protein product [Closterium sp. Naga37s-1]